MKRVIGLLIGAVMVLCFMACSPDDVPVEERHEEAIVQSTETEAEAIGFEDEEDAIEYFINKLNEGDLDAAMNACAYKMMAENYDYEAMAETLYTIMPVARQSSSDYDLGVRLNTIKFESEILKHLNLISFQLNSQGEYPDMLESSITMVDDVDLDFVMECFDPSVLEELELVEIFTEEETELKKHKELMYEQASIYGADNISIHTVIYKYNGDYYQSGARLIQYDGLWYIIDLNEVLSDNANPYGTLYKFEDGEYQ